MNQPQKNKKIKILELFYEHLEEDVWTEGVEIYQSERIKKLDIYHNLITAHVESHYGKDEEVRIKTHPSGRVIQWIECTCKKNRKFGQYCEHIAGLIIQIDREYPHLFANLDQKMPFKHLVSPKIKKTSHKQVEIPASKDKKIAAAESDKSSTDNYLTQLMGIVHKIKSLRKGQILRVFTEIKSGKKSAVDLDIDEAFHFLKTQPNSVLEENQLNHLSLGKIKGSLGTIIYAATDEKCIAEQALIIKKQKNSSFESLLAAKIPYAELNCKKLENKKSRYQTHLIFSYKHVQRFIGNELAFIPDHGYVSVEKEKVDSGWFELPLTKVFNQDQTAKLIQTQFEDYRSAGPVWVAESIGRQEIIAPQIKSIEVSSERGGWFYLDPVYGKGNSYLSMAEMIHHHKKNRKFVKKENKWIEIPDFVSNHQWELDHSQKRLKVDLLGIFQLKANAAANIKLHSENNLLLKKVHDKINFDPTISVPDLSHTYLKLRKYQMIGYKWLWWLYSNHLNGLLADDMGLGKTHQAMALLSAIQLQNKQAQFLVICPTTVLDHWADKMETYAPNLQVHKYHGPKRGPHLQKQSNSGTVLTSYGILLREIKKLETIDWDAVILDEAHYVKNNNTATYRAACRLKSRIRLCLSGTPMENNLTELKNIYDFLLPGYLGTDLYFKKKYLTPIEQNNDSNTETHLKSLVSPLKLRRSKDQVLKDLPDKIEDIRHCGLSQEQIKLYRDIVNLRSKPLINQLKKDKEPIPYLHVFATLQLLKQVCNHPALIKAGSDYRKHQSEKFELLKEIIRESVSSEHKVVIFSQYIGMINIIKQYCHDEGIGHAVLTGQTRNRGQIIHSFQNNPEIKIFIGSLLAGGVGIDLTAASVVIHYDRWWNAAKENQATDRVHRIGQKKFVQVFKLVTRGTLEERIDEMIAKKFALFNRFLEKDEEVFKTLSRNDLIELLQ